MGQRRSVDKREGHSDFVEEGAAKTMSTKIGARECSAHLGPFSLYHRYRSKKEHGAGGGEGV